jgi:small-conductance mechanosensitive channel
MKIIALILLILNGLLIIPVGFMALFVFAMSFDAPGSDKGIKQWAARIGFIVIPALIPVALVFFGYQAFQAGNYMRVIWITSIPIILAIGYFIYTGLFKIK